MTARRSGSQQFAFPRPAAADRLSWATNPNFYPSLEQVKTEWGLNRRIGLTPRRPVSIPHRIGGPIWLTTGKRPNPGILPAHKPKGRPGKG